MTTNVPNIQWTPTGLVVPSEAAVLAGVLADFNAAFGGNLNITNLSTPQGQLASSIAAAISNCYAQFTNLVNGVNPDLNSGFMQDAIARIYFCNRNEAVQTIVMCQCTGGGAGVPVPIPSGSLAIDTSGNVYAAQLPGTLPAAGGTITLPFANVVAGPIPCAANTLTQIYQAIDGWDSITNASAGVVGSAVESAQAFEYRREQTVAANGKGSGPAVYGAVFDVPGVIDAYYIENDTNAPVNVGSTSFVLGANTIFVGVIGGTAAAIAQAIYTKKSPGCNMAGNTTVLVPDPSGYAPPVPTYQITFNNNGQNPANTFFAISIPNLPNLPSDIVSLIQQAIVNQFTGASGSPRARIGSLLAAANYAGSVQTAAGAGIVIPVLAINVGTAFAGTATTVNASNQIAVATVVEGQLSFGTQLTGTYIPAGTYIVEQLSGTAGGVGTYLMSQEATGSSGGTEVISGAPGPSAQYGIDQAPEIAEANVTVTLV